MDRGLLATTEEPQETPGLTPPPVPPIVGIGASAGGLEPLERFFTHLQADTGMAFVVVQHMGPGHDLLLPELLQRKTPMQVVQAADHTVLEPNRVYAVPPDSYPSPLKGVLHLFSASNAIPQHHPIDFLFRSLARDISERSVAVILSGAGQDGTAGARAVKEHGGLVLVQDPAGARFSGMPASVIDAGLADLVCQPEELAGRLVGLGGRFSQRGSIDLGARREEREVLDKIVLLLRDRTGHDFSSYKKNTLFRRIERRMVIHEVGGLDLYLRFLQANPNELDLLFRELLIGVTSFFRDPHEWEVLERVVIPELLASRQRGSVLRVWSAGCSTGEEAYSLAIAFQEAMENHGKRDCSVQIFATDADPRAIEHARRGIFPASIAAEVPADRLERYFVRQGSCYQISSDIRELITFAGHNILSDPPFIKLDLLVCRNLLVYLEPDIQKSMLSLFHYALKPDTFLFLGPAESVGAARDLFTPVTGKSRLCRRLQASCHEPVTLPSGMLARPAASAEGNPPGSSLQRSANQYLLSHHTPPALLMRQSGDILYIKGGVGKYLEFNSGKVNLNLFAMAGVELRAVLAAAISQAMQQVGPVTIRAIQLPGKERLLLDVTLERLIEPETLRGLLLVLFQEYTQPRPSRGRSPRVAELEAELDKVRAQLHNYGLEMQDAREDLNAANDELQATNEELQSTNEELQSTIEDLFTAKEDLRRANEAMETLNLRQLERIEQLEACRDEADHFLDSTGIATIILDQEIRVRRFTPQAGSMFHLLPVDVGRPLSDLACSLEWNSFPDDARQVFQAGIPLERSVRSRDGRHYLARLHPFRWGSASIEGVVATFCDVTSLVVT